MNIEEFKKLDPESRRETFMKLGERSQAAEEFERGKIEAKKEVFNVIDMEFLETMRWLNKSINELLDCDYSEGKHICLSNIGSYFAELGILLNVARCSDLLNHEDYSVLCDTCADLREKIWLLIDKDSLMRKYEMDW